MARSRRPRIPGIPKDAERNVESIIREFEERIRKLEQKAGRPGFVSSDTAAVPGEFLNIEAPAAGLIVILPQATAALRNARVTLNTRNANPVKVVCIGGTVNGSSFVTNDSAGTFEAVCNGYDGWSLPGYVTPSGSGLLGRTGLMGPPGFDGIDGAESFIPGPVGLTGKPGCQGPPGFDGLDGADSFVPGPAGVAGAAGAAGATGPEGRQGPPGEMGPEGQESFVPGPPGPTGKFVPTSDTVILSGISGAQGVVDISGLECGGRVGIQAPVGNWSIEGFTAREEGFWFIVTVASTDFLGTITNSTTAGTGIRCPGFTDFTCERQMQGVAMYGSFGSNTQWLFVPGAGGPLCFGDPATMPTAGDIRKGSDDELELNAALGIRAIATGANGILLSTTASVAASASGAVTLDATSTSRFAVGAGADIDMRQERLQVEGVGGSGGSIVNVQEVAASPTVDAGYVGFGARDLAPSQARITDDVNADWDVNMFGCAVATNIPSVTAGTGSVTAVTFSVPGNTLRVGTTYVIDAIGNFSRGATATALNITFSLNFGGTIYQTSGAIAANTAAGTYFFHVKAFFTCLSIGAAGTFIGQMQIINNLPAAVTLAQATSTSVSTAAAGTTKNTTAAQTLSLTAAMSAAVASTTLRFTNAVLYKASN